MKKILHKILFFLCLVNSVILLTAYLAPFVSPEITTITAFAALAYPYLLGVNILFTIYWIIRRRWSFLLPLIVILLGYNQFANFVQFHTPKDVDNDIKIVTYNVRLFDKYKWSNNPETTKNMLQLLQKSQCDIYCFQEFRPNKKGLLSVQSIQKKINCNYNALSKKQNDLAIFSKYPILFSGELQFNKGDMGNAVFADIKIKNEIIRVYNLHLQSNRLSGINYSFIKQKSFDADKVKVEELKDICKRLNDAFIRRAKQAEIVRYHISQSPYPVLVCGDFNDTAFSYTYHKITDKLTDTFRERGSGISITYIGDFPSFRIDFMLHDKHFVCNRYRRIRKKYSDHYSIYTELSFKK